MRGKTMPQAMQRKVMIFKILSQIPEMAPMAPLQGYGIAHCELLMFNSS
jgi:hypothetical protein